MTRDNAVWTVLLIGGTVTYIIGHFDKFPWIPQSAQGVVELVGVLAGIIGAKLGMSPLDLSNEGQMKARAGVL